MILAIDAGNSRVKWGWYEAGAGGKGKWTGIANVSLIEFAASSDHSRHQSDHWSTRGMRLFRSL